MGAGQGKGSVVNIIKTHGVRACKCLNGTHHYVPYMLAEDERGAQPSPALASKSQSSLSSNGFSKNLKMMGPRVRDNKPN